MALSATEIAEIYRENGDAIFGYLLRQTADKQLSLDLIGETFAVAIEKRDTFRGGDRAQVVAWLYSIAKRLLVDYYRRGASERRAMKRLGLDRLEHSDQPGDQLEVSESRLTAREEFEALTASLSPDDRLVIQLRLVEKKSYADIADLLEIGEDAVRARVSRAMNRARRIVTIHRDAARSDAVRQDGGVSKG